MADAPLTSIARGSRPSAGSAGRRGLALVAGFWVVITAILVARVALFDQIAAAHVAEFVSVHYAALTSAVLP